ncbi:hypothetical protein BLS_009419 [Venturia inaequalis]|uniref:DUF1214 domain-containing protein n=1 Tax=Venturia inaequalis TaxID=5025 RepID=A0A8H3ZAL5_VENIN|nr:hypothetical protein BLS_009419 [Venturia inaequalis]KAE9991854.1 hypothetical protein EG327_010731 [Venturia inaequalis]
MKTRTLFLLQLPFWDKGVHSQAASSSSSITSTTSAASPSSSASVPIININSTVASTLNATAWALVYTYPLYIFGNFAGNVLRNVGVNEIFHQRNLASVDSPGVIKPNVDTTYSRVVLDLSKQDLILTVPNITDSFGNIIAEIGAVNKNKPGNYLIRRADDVAGPSGLQNASDLSTATNAQSRPHNASAYAGIVNLPTTHGTMLIRLLVLQNTTADLNIIHGYQNASTITPIQRNVTLAPSPAGNISSLAPNGTLLGINSPEKLLTFASRFIEYNQPELLSERQRVAGILGAAGIYNGHNYAPETGVNLTYASRIANASIATDVNNSSHIRNQGNGWQLSIASYQGNFGANYGGRAYVAIAGYQQQTTIQTLYPGYQSTGFTSSASLAANKSLLITFSRKPILEQFGFWSLTVYGADQYLIPNSLNRFEVGDRSFNLTYQGSGNAVYGPSANKTEDGSFQVLVQPANLVPPTNWTGNWLPAARDISFITRWYVPSPAMTNGSYVYPKVETIDSIG